MGENYFFFIKIVFLLMLKITFESKMWLWWQHSKESMCRLQNIAMRDYQESVTTGQTDGGTDRRRTKWSLCDAGNTKILEEVN